jgi:hypothetical protein
MGQYYRPVFLNEKNKPLLSVSSYDFGSGAKLMEHSWMGNSFVRFVEKHLMLQPQKLVWAGDYADNENPKTLTKADIKPHIDNDNEYWNEKKILEDGLTLYTLSENVGKLTPDEDIPKDKDKWSYKFKKVAPLTAKYLVNFDKKEFVNKSKTPISNDGWQIHPLPLLTCEGNGRGGGDYHESDKPLVEDENGVLTKKFKLVGRWSRNKIGVVSKKSDIPKDFKEIIFNLKE